MIGMGAGKEMAKKPMTEWMQMADDVLLSFRFSCQ
jgi:hypothetical protein